MVKVRLRPFPLMEGVEVRSRRFDPREGQCYSRAVEQLHSVSGTLGERAAERRGQAHQPLEPDLGKSSRYVGAEDERREAAGSGTMVTDFLDAVVFFFDGGLPPSVKDASCASPRTESCLAVAVRFVRRSSCLSLRITSRRAGRST